MRSLTKEEQALGEWLKNQCAALGVECHSLDIAGHERGPWPAYLPHFGGPHGMVIGSANLEYPSPALLYVSLVNPNMYFGTNQKLLQESLDDWGWFGPPDKRPPWFTGAAWGRAADSGSSQFER